MYLDSVRYFPQRALMREHTLSQAQLTSLLFLQPLCLGTLGQQRLHNIHHRVDESRQVFRTIDVLQQTMECFFLLLKYIVEEMLRALNISGADILEIPHISQAIDERAAQLVHQLHAHHA